ncbi:MAG: hypothetical protein ACHBN1_30405 [Heteroscytonema crispum UTEX LB 1556]
MASLRWEQIDWNSGTIYVKWVKKGTPSTHPLYSEEIRSPIFSSLLDVARWHMMRSPALLNGLVS